MDKGGESSCFEFEGDSSLIVRKSSDILSKSVNVGSKKIKHKFKNESESILSDNIQRGALQNLN